MQARGGPGHHRERAEAAGVEPLAVIVDHAVVAGPDHSLHTKPSRAARQLLERHGMSAHDVDLWEINEAFAAVALASMADLDIEHARVNVNGGAIALGHPLGASGFRLLLTLALEMRRSGARPVSRPSVVVAARGRPCCCGLLDQVGADGPPGPSGALAMGATVSLMSGTGVSHRPVPMDADTSS